MKKIRFSKHSLEQCDERGTSQDEVIQAVRTGTREPAKHARISCKINLSFHSQWQGKFYAIKQVMPIITEEDNEIIVITVYTYYF
ncbi:MAG TPA: hypothetical protein ENI73_04220 [Spirochaetes bacterium]|nr:hypothetical protein [Spirochaetota bacterium]